VAQAAEVARDGQMEQPAVAYELALVAGMAAVLVARNGGFVQGVRQRLGCAFNLCRIGELGREGTGVRVVLRHLPTAAFIE
jgi:hypothetical protein